MIFHPSKLTNICFNLYCMKIQYSWWLKWVAKYLTTKSFIETRHSIISSLEDMFSFKGLKNMA
ncbi:hypothetical protein DXO98_25890, partial [Salmonella enterica]|nr:hypothetical protein [Salmonella enterica]